MIVRYWLHAAAVAACLAGASVAPALAASSPLAVVKDIYATDKKSFDGVENAPDVVTDEALRDRFFSKSLAAAIKKDSDDAAKVGDEGNLDFDPISDSQDPMVKALKFEAISTTADAAVVRVSFSQGEPKRDVLDYHMILEDGEWRVDEISKAGTDGWSLRSVVKGP